MSKPYKGWTTKTPPYGLLWVVTQTVLLTLKLDGTLADTSWWIILAPCWAITALTVIIFAIMGGVLRVALKHANKETIDELNREGEIKSFVKHIVDFDEEDDDEDTAPKVKTGKIEIKQSQPHWVCNRCGKMAQAAHAAYYGTCPGASISTFHAGICEICGRAMTVTEIRDYGYPDINLLNLKYIKNLDKAIEEAKDGS